MLVRRLTTRITRELLPLIGEAEVQTQLEWAAAYSLMSRQYSSRTSSSISTGIVLEE